MAEYIEREAARTLFAGYGSTDQFDALLDTIPAADVVGVRHGQYISTGFDELYCEFGDCSICGANMPRGSDYCPNCGAKMDGGDDNDV